MALCKRVRKEKENGQVKSEKGVNIRNCSTANGARVSPAPCANVLVLNLKNLGLSALPRPAAPSLLAVRLHARGALCPLFSRKARVAVHVRLRIWPRCVGAGLCGQRRPRGRARGCLGLDLR